MTLEGLFIYFSKRSKEKRGNGEMVKEDVDSDEEIIRREGFRQWLPFKRSSVLPT